MDVIQADMHRQFPFLAIILSLSSRNATARMRAWRALKAWGSAVLRDGVYLLPTSDDHQQRLTGLVAEIRETGGQAEVLLVTPQTSEQENSFYAMFDRSGEYDSLLAEMDKLDPAFPDLNHLKKSVRALHRRFAEVISIDFFPGQAQQKVAMRLSTLEAEINTRFSPGEPSSYPGGIETLDTGDFHGRLWVTRSNLGVDRLTSAWLIARFIDAQARFAWFSTPKEMPQDAVGFDFDGARFSHVGARVTFETLLASFVLEDNPALARIARLVHVLDVGEGFVEEAPGFLALFQGMKVRIRDDDALLKEGKRILDDYYLFFSNQEEQS